MKQGCYEEVRKNAGLNRVGEFKQKGIENIKDLPKLSKDAGNLVEPTRCKVKGLYFAMGRYVLIAVVEALDDQAMMKISLVRERVGHIREETLKAFPVNGMINVVEELPQKN